MMVSVKVIKFVDKYLGFLICLFLSVFNISNPKISPKKILIVQLWGIGETVLALPMIKILSQNSKNSVIEVLTTTRVDQVFYNNKNIKKVNLIQLNVFSIFLFMIKNYNKYDLVIDMEEYLNISSIISFFCGKRRIGYDHSIRTLLYTDKVTYNDSQHVVQTHIDLLSPLGIHSKASSLEKLNYSATDSKKVDSYLKKNKISSKDFLVGIGAGAAESSRTRMWPIERFSKIIDFLTENYNAKIILVGSSNEFNLNESIIKNVKNKDKVINSSGKTDLRELFCLIGKLDLFVGNDSGPMHIAAAQGVKTIGLFGCNLPVRFGPFGSKGYPIRKQSTKPCINVHKAEIDECRFGEKNSCVKKIKVQDVIDLAKKIIKK